MQYGKKILAGVGAVVVALCAGSAQSQSHTPESIEAAVGAVNSAAIVENAEKTKNWPSYGLDYAETRFSRLSRIDVSNVDRLGLAWSYNLESRRGVEATPIVVDGVLYVTGSWSIVHARDARTGKRLWVYDPEVPLRGRHVILVDDIVDSGKTIRALLPVIRARGPASLEVCTLLHKRRNGIECSPRWVGFNAPAEFIVGYGLDYSENFRHLPYIASV